MKTPLFFFITCLFISLSVSGQDTQKQKELGLSFTDLNGFGVFYRVGKPTALWRFNSAFGSFSNQKNTADNGDVTTTNSSNFSFSIGREYRKSFLEAIEGRLGFDASLGFVKNKVKFDADATNVISQSTSSVGPGLRAVLGLNYVIKDKLIVGIEIRPGLAYSSSKMEVDYRDIEDLTSKSKGFSASFSNSALITIGLRL